MAKKKVHELAKEFDVQSKDIIGFFAEQGIDKKAGSNVEDQEYDMVKNKFAKSAAGSAKKEPEKQDAIGVFLFNLQILPHHGRHFSHFVLLSGSMWWSR